ncbi:hypothetical protein WA538_002800, partial [Blastocystis sp. DL]
MSVPSTYKYTSFDKRWMQVVSKDDALQILVDNEWKRGHAIQLNLDTVRLRLDGTDIYKDVNCSFVKILEKKIRQNQLVPIEVNDLVTLQYEADVVSAIVTQVQNYVKLVITSPKSIGKEIFVQPNQLRYVAKGYTLYELPPLNSADHAHNPINSQPLKSNGILRAASSSSPMPNNQMNSGMALLYPAPCIIMAIPPLNDPADFPEAMAVQFPWRQNDTPTVLPVIRMSPGTMVVVVPGSSSVGILANQGPVQVPVQPVTMT